MKRPDKALPGILRPCDVRQVSLVSQDLLASPADLFYDAIDYGKWLFWVHLLTLCPSRQPDHHFPLVYHVCEISLKSDYFVSTRIKKGPGAP